MAYLNLKAKPNAPHKEKFLTAEPVMPNEQRNLNLIIGELRMAEQKHPEFCKGMATTTAENVKKYLSHCRKEKAERGTCDWILAEEIYEAFEAYQNGNLQQCLVELAQCGAVILRMMEMVAGEIKAGDRA